MKRIVSRGVGSHHGVQHGQRLAHAGGQGDLGQFANSNQALVEDLDGGVVPSDGQAGMYNAANLEAPALYVPSAVAGARVVGRRCHADERGDLAAVQSPQLGKLGSQAGSGRRADAAGRVRQLVERSVMFAHVADHLRLDLVELLADGLDHRLDAWTHHGDGQLQPLALGQRLQLAAASDHRGQDLVLGVGERADGAGQVLAARQHCGELREQARIDCIGFRQTPHRLGEVARLTQIDHRHGKAGRLQRAGKSGLIAADGFLSRPGPRPAAAGSPPAPSGPPYRYRNRWASRLAPSTATSTCALDTSMSTATEITDMIFRFVACASALGKTGARNRSGFTKTGAAVVRHLLIDGLTVPSQNQAVRAGLVASTTPKLYRGGLV